jgi:hypothetical protein
MRFSKHALSTIAYVAVTFAVQATSHFWVNQAHYATVSFLRKEPVFALGIASMLLQGSILSIIYARYAWGAASWRTGLVFGLGSGAFFVSYQALAEPAKYAVPSILAWTVTESLVGVVQFGLFGAVLGVIHARFVRHPADSSLEVANGV